MTKPINLKNNNILVLNDALWDEAKRVRHKMAAAWAREGNRVLWVERNSYLRKELLSKGIFAKTMLGEIRQVEERLMVGAGPPAFPRCQAGGILGNLIRFLHRPFFLRRIKSYLRGLDFTPDLLVLFQLAPRWDLIRHLPHEVSIYYCNDLLGYGLAAENVHIEERRCCQAVDLVFTTSEVLRKRLSPFNPHTHHIPHAVDKNWWEKNRAHQPAEYSRIPSPRAAFTGVISSIVDLSLLIQMADSYPFLQLVMVGPVLHYQIDQEQLNQLESRPNVHFLGFRPIDELPGYIEGADILLLPYHTKHRNAFASGLALKFYEYMISGNPILATPFTDFETEHKDLLYIGENFQEWKRLIPLALNEQSLTTEIRAMRVSLANENTYDKRLDQQREILRSFAGR